MGEATGRRHHHRAIAAGVATGLSILLLCHVVPPPLPALLAAVAIAFTPTASDLAPRLCVNLVGALAWVPFTMWLPASYVGGSRVTVILAVASGAVVTCRLWPGTTVRLLPRIGASDLAVPLAGGVAGVAAWPLAAPRPADAVLASLLQGWDNAGHFFMYYQQRTATVAAPLGSGPADGSSWEYRNYVQWTHSSMALAAEALWGTDASNSSAELVRYARLEWGFYVLCATLIAAVTAHVTRSTLTRRGSFLMSSAASVTLTGVPGARLLLLGHGVFFVIVVVVACTVVLLLFEDDRRWVTLFATSGIVVSLGWVFLTPLVCVVAGLRLQSAVRAASHRARLSLLVAAAITSLATTWVGAHLRGQAAAVTFVGEVPRPHPLAVIAMFLLVAALATSRKGATRGRIERRGIAALLATASLELGLLAWYQIASIGRLEYYWWKLASGVCVVLAVPVVVLVSRRFLASSAMSAFSRGLRLSTLVFTVGVVGLGACDLDIPAPALASTSSLPSALLDNTRRPEAQRLIALSASPPCSAGPLRTTILAPTAYDPTGINTDQWFHALTLTRTSQVVAAFPAAGVQLSDAGSGPPPPSSWAFWRPGDSLGIAGGDCTPAPGRG